MSSKITPEQSNPSSNLQENKNLSETLGSKDLSQLTRKKLYRIYLDEVGDVNDLEALAKMNQLDFDKNKLIASRRNITDKTLQSRLQKFKYDLINDIIAAREARAEEEEEHEIQSECEALTDSKAKAYGEASIDLSKIGEIKLKPLSEIDRIKLENQELKRENQMLRNYIQSTLTKLIPQKQQEIKSLIESKQATLEHNKPLIVEGIKNNVPEILPIPPTSTHPHDTFISPFQSNFTNLEDVKLKQLSENKILKDYIQNIRSKQIVEGIPKRIPKHPSINKIRKINNKIREAQAKGIPAPIKSKPYGESEVFTKEHCNMSFEE